MRECLSVYCEWCFTCEGDFLSCRLGLTLRKPLAASDELLASPFLRPSVALCDRQESEDKFSNFNIMYSNVFWPSLLGSCGMFYSSVRIVHQKSPKGSGTYPSPMSENHSLGKKGHSNNKQHGWVFLVFISVTNSNIHLLCKHFKKALKHQDKIHT